MGRKPIKKVFSLRNPNKFPKGKGNKELSGIKVNQGRKFFQRKAQTFLGNQPFGKLKFPSFKNLRKFNLWPKKLIS